MVPAGSRIRLHLKLKTVEPVENGGTRVTSEGTIEIEGGSRPVLVAETIGMVYD
jgi:acyl dehydratase